jgi:hypothetical protein
LEGFLVEVAITIVRAAYSGAAAAQQAPVAFCFAADWAFRDECAMNARDCFVDVSSRPLRRNHFF